MVTIIYRATFRIHHTQVEVEDTKATAVVEKIGHEWPKAKDITLLAIYVAPNGQERIVERRRL